VCANALHRLFWLFKEGVFIPYISDVIDIKDLRPDSFNLVSAGCGTGKTYWVINNLAKEIPGVLPCEIAFVTSRAITKEQQAKNRGTTKLRRNDEDILSFWNDNMRDNEEVLLDYGILLLTYDQIISAIRSQSPERSEVLRNLKVVVFDECHTMFCDTFIHNINSLHMWIREVIYAKNRKLLVGLSATTGIIEQNSSIWGVPINRINKEVIAGHQAKQLIGTTFRSLPYLFAKNELPGKSIVMCHSIEFCRTLASKVDNSTVLISPHSKGFTPEMGRIRDHIIKYEELPPVYYDDTGQPHELKVLIATSTLREGLNLRESSGVRNVISCMADDLHVIQFAGRCRYDYDNLVLADSFIGSDRYEDERYMMLSRKKFKDYIEDKIDSRWFAAVSHLVAHDFDGVKRFVLGSDWERFIDYINERWLMPPGLSKEQQISYRIWRDGDKAEIIDAAVECKMFNLYKSRTKFTRIVDLLEQSLGYTIESGRAVLGGERQVYKIISAYDPQKNIYDPAVPTEVDGFNFAGGNE